VISTLVAILVWFHPPDVGSEPEDQVWDFDRNEGIQPIDAFWSCAQPVLSFRFVLDSICALSVSVRLRPHRPGHLRGNA